MKKTIQLAVSLLVAAILIYFSLKNIDLDQAFSTISQAKPIYIIISGALALIAHWARGKRWALLLEPIHQNPSVKKGFAAVLVGYIANLAFPRAGEVARVAVYQRTDGVPFEKGVGTVVTERIFDIVCLLVLIMLNFLVEFDRLKSFFGELLAGKIPQGSNLYVLGGSLLAILIVAFFLFKKYQDKILAFGPVKKLFELGKSLLDGILSITKMKNPGLFLLLTALIWLMYYLSSYILFFSLPHMGHLGPLAGLTVLVVGAIGMTAPTQGGIGAYHLLVGKVVMLYGLSQQEGITLATFLHGCQTLYAIVFGIAALIYVNALKKTKA